MFDMSGAPRYRDLWDSYYRTSDAVIFVVDSADTGRILLAKEVLTNMLQSNRFIPLLLQ